MPLTWQSQAGVEITKNFIFTRDSHLINVDFVVKNNKGAGPKGQTSNMQIKKVAFKGVK